MEDKKAKRKRHKAEIHNMDDYWEEQGTEDTGSTGKRKSRGTEFFGDYQERELAGDRGGKRKRNEEENRIMEE